MYSYNDIHDRLSAFLKTAGYNPTKDVTFIPVSAYTGNKYVQLLPS